MCFVLCIIIVVEGADDGISLVGGVLYGWGGIVLAIIRDGQSLDARRHISEPYIADCPFGLADRLDMAPELLERFTTRKEDKVTEEDVADLLNEAE